MNLGGVVQSGQEALAKNCERIPCAAGNDSHKPMQDTKVVIAVHVRQGTGRSKILRVYIYIYAVYRMYFNKLAKHSVSLFVVYPSASGQHIAI